MSSFQSFQKNTKQYTAAGGVVVFGKTVMLLFVPKRSEYRLPKGHIEKGETPAATALREVSEESGVAHLSILADLGTQTVEFDNFNKHIIRLEYYYLMNLDSQEDQQPAEDKFKVVWMPWTVAIQRASFEAEKEWLRRAQSAWQKLQV